MKFLLNVGAEKAGTTWLYAYFHHHPEFYSIGKELNIVQRDDLFPTFVMIPEAKADIEVYFDMIKEQRSMGDFTHYEGSTPNIYKMFKDGLEKRGITVVPVYIMRDPIKRAWSAWNMLGGGSIDMPHPAYFLMINYLSCKYKETVEALDSIFENPLYFFYEDFFKQEHVDRICDALEISQHPVIPHVVNKGNYQGDIPQDFVEQFGRSIKNKEAVEYIYKRFENVPWNIEDYTQKYC